MASPLFEAFGSLRNASDQETVDKALNLLVAEAISTGKDDGTSGEYVVQRIVRGLCTDRAIARLNFLCALKAVCAKNKQLLGILANQLCSFEEFTQKQLEPHSKRQKTNVDLAFVLGVTFLFDALQSADGDAIPSERLGKLVSMLRETMRRKAQLCALGLHALTCLLRSRCEPFEELNQLITQSATSGWAKATETNVTILLAALNYRPTELSTVLNGKDTSQSQMDTDDDEFASRTRKRFLKKFWHVDALLHHSNATHLAKLLAEARNEYPTKREVPLLLVHYTLKFEPASLGLLFDYAEKNVKHIDPVALQKTKAKKDKRANGKEAHPESKSDSVPAPSRMTIKDACFITELLIEAANAVRTQQAGSEQLTLLSTAFSSSRIAAVAQLPDSVPLKAQFVSAFKLCLESMLGQQESVAAQSRLPEQLSALLVAFASHSSKLFAELLVYIARLSTISDADWHNVLRQTLELWGASERDQRRPIATVWCTLLTHTALLTQLGRADSQSQTSQPKVFRGCLTALFSEALKDSLAQLEPTDDNTEAVRRPRSAVNISQISGILKRLLWQTDQQARSNALQIVLGSLRDASRQLSDTDQDAKRLHKALKRVKSTKSDDQSSQPDADAFSLMLVAASVALLDRNDAESREELFEILADIHTASERRASEADTQAANEDEPNWRVVLMECVLALLSDASYFVRELLVRAVEATQWSVASIALVRDAIFSAHVDPAKRQSPDSEDENADADALTEVHKDEGKDLEDEHGDEGEDVEMNDEALVNEFKKRVAMLGEAEKRRVDDKKQRKQEETKLLHFRLRCIDLIGALLNSALANHDDQVELFCTVAKAVIEVVEKLRSVNRNAAESSQLLSALTRTLTAVRLRFEKERKTAAAAERSLEIGTLRSLLPSFVRLVCASSTYKVSDSCVRPLQSSLAELGRLLIAQLDVVKPTVKISVQQELVAIVPTELQKAGFGVQMTHTVAQLVRADRVFWLPLSSTIEQLLNGSNVSKAYERTQLLRLLRAYYLVDHVNEESVQQLLAASVSCSETALRCLAADAQGDTKTVKVEYIVAALELLTATLRLFQSTLKRTKNGPTTKFDAKVAITTVDSWKTAHYRDGPIANVSVRKIFNTCMRFLRAAAGESEQQQQQHQQQSTALTTGNQNVRKNGKKDSAKRRKLI